MNSLPPLRGRTPVVLLAVIALALSASAQSADDLAAELQRERAAREALATQLATERAAREALEARVTTMEANWSAERADDDIEAQLRRLVDPSAFETAAPRTLIPSALNPRIGVYSDATIKGGNDDNKLDDGDPDRFSLREVELDARLPISPWAEGVTVFSFEEQGSNGEYESTIEEGYADVQLGGLFDNDMDELLKIGRMRVAFGHDNKLHTHDLLQTDRPWAVQQLLGEEGIFGDGLELTIPVSHRETDEGLGRTSTAIVSVMNGDMFTGDGTPLAAEGDDAGVGLSSSDPVIAGRWTEFMEITRQSDLELGASYIRNLGSQAIETDAGTDVQPEAMGVDVTFRTRDDENGVGSWLFIAEAIRTDFDFGDSTGPTFPTGTQRADGAYLTVQRQMTPTTYLGLRVGKTDTVGSDETVTDFTPYFTWYADEFFRIRLQGEHLQADDTSSGDESINRAYLQFTWNFGAHSPHPYWTNM